MSTAERKPRITVMGEEIDYDDLPETGPIELADHFKPVKLSPRAVNEASRAVPQQYFQLEGLHTWLEKRANHVFSKMPTSEKRARLKGLVYEFEFDADGPVLKSVHLANV